MPPSEPQIVAEDATDDWATTVVHMVFGFAVVGLFALAGAVYVVWRAVWR